jgi:hypothetical protein
LSWRLFIAVPIIVGEQIVNFTFSNRHISESSSSNPPNESRLKKFANVIKKLRETSQNAVRINRSLIFCEVQPPKHVTSFLMWPVINVLLQSGLGSLLPVLGATGAQAVAVNTAGQAAIHGLAVVAGPAGWVISGILTGLTLILL